MIISTNFTEYGIHSTGERYVWITYLLIVLLSSLIGDSIILIATVRYNAIKLNKFLVVVMQHIAVCDILAALSFVLPTMISLISNIWVLGDTLAYINVYFHYYSTQCSTLFICALTTSKLLILTFPLRKRFWSQKNAHLMSAFIWTFAHIFPALRFIFDKNGLIFGYDRYNINYGQPSEYSNPEKLIIYLSTALTSLTPVVGVVVTTCGTLTYLIRSRHVTARSGGSQRWQGMVTVVITGSVFCVSVIPDTVSFIVLTVKSSEGVELSRYTEVGRVAEFLTTLNIMCNFYIYSLTIPSFRRFIVSKAL